MSPARPEVPLVEERAKNGEGPLARVALRFTDWTERWVPDAFVFALAATVVVFALGVAIAGASPIELVGSWGGSFWGLAKFTLQMALIIVTGYVLASSRPVFRVIARIARLPRTARGATTMVALFAMTTSWLNWGFSLIFSAMLAKETARRRPEADYRALAASSFLGLGSIWAQGLSGSAALQMATPGGTIPEKVREIVGRGGMVPGGMIPLRHTIFLWQSFVCVVVEIAIVLAVVWLYTPPPARAKTARDLGVDLGAPPEERSDGAPTPASIRPGERLEHSPLLTLLIVALGVTYLGWYVRQARSALDAVNLDTINLAFLTLGFLLHWTPARLMQAVRDATPATWGVILQFPFYAGIEGMITHSRLNQQIASLFVSVSTKTTFPPLVALYSTVLGVFVPSGGSKWVIEAPYVMAAAHEQQVHLGWMVCVYDLGEALANLVQPFWMLPTLALLGLKARDVMGFTFIVFLVLLPVVLTLVTVLGATLAYPL
jgi:short-chain fatty acids transporter